MDNKMIINYTYMIENKKEEWIDIINTSDVNLSWIKNNFQIVINWNWGEESKAKELVERIMTIFGDAEIVIENSKGKTISLPKETKNSISINPEEKNGEVAAETFVENNSCETKIIINEEVKKEDNSTSKKEDPISELTLSLSHEEKIEIKKADYEKALKELFGSKIEKYDFTTEKAVKEAMRFCLDYEIKSEALKYALTFVGTASNESALINGLSRLLYKNTALAKIELRKDFEKWMKSTYPSFLEKYTEVNVFHFLNIFRNENKKF